MLNEEDMKCCANCKKMYRHGNSFCCNDIDEGDDRIDPRGVCYSWEQSVMKEWDRLLLNQ